MLQEASNGALWNVLRGRFAAPQDEVWRQVNAIVPAGRFSVLALRGLQRGVQRVRGRRPGGATGPAKSRAEMTPST
jgi:hypothetical protein